MKNTKRLLAYILAFTMVFSCFAGISLTAKASESKGTAVEIAVGDAKAVTIDTAGESYWVKFTPEEDGKYIFYSQGEWDTHAYLYNENSEELDYDDGGMNDAAHNFRISYEMVAGQTYYLKSCFWNEERTGEYTLHLEKQTTATSISFDEDTYEGFAGETVSFEFLFAPVYAVENLTYSVDEEGIINIEEGWTYAELVSPGTVTLTVTTESGCTDSCTITVKAVKEITDGETGTVETVDGEKETYAVTVKEDGTYMLYSDDCDSAYFYLYTDEGTIYSYYDGDALVLVADLKAGESYRCSCYNNGREPYTIHLMKMVDATGISVGEEAVEGYPGDEFYLDVTRTPIYSYDISGNIAWTSNNEAVATVNEYGEVVLIKEGTATITAKTDSGFTDTCNVTVKAVPTISLDTKTTVTIEDDGQIMTYAFTPAKDGTYGFYSDTSKDVYGFICNEAGEEIAYNDDNGEDYNFLVEAELEAGKTYYLKAGLYNYGVASFDVYVTEMKAATEMSFYYDSLTGYVGENKWQNVIFGPGIVKSEEWELSSADKTIVAIEYGEIRLLKAGTTTITAESTESDLRCTCTITVKNPEQLTLDQELTVEVKEDQGRIYFTYRPAEDEGGTYAFYSTDDNGFFCSLNDENGWLNSDEGSGVGNNFKIVHDLEEEKTYTYIYEISSDNCDSVSVKLQKATEEVTGIELSHSTINGYVDLGSQLKVNVLPTNSTGDIGEVTWTSSNPEIVEIEYSYGLYCGLNFKAEGTATITAEANGYTDSCVITVGKIPEIKVNDTKKVNIEYKQDYEAYTFTPEKDGTYVFSSANAASPVLCVVLDAERHVLDEDCGTTDEPNVSLEFKLKAGETYTFVVGYDSSNKTGTFAVTLIDKDNPPVVTPDNPSDNTNQTTNNNTNNQNTASPTTGDMQVTWTWGMLMMVAVVAGFGVVVYRKKENE